MGYKQRVFKVGREECQGGKERWRERDRRGFELNKLYECMECSENKKNSNEIQFILLFIFSLSPNMNIGHVFQKCSLKALIELLSSQ